jgi:hypothetical protein
MMMPKERFRKSQTLAGTQKIHCVILASKNQVQTIVFSEENVFNTTQIIHVQDEEYQAEDIGGYDKVS